jgi:excisionase family DNA binding protein
MEPVTVTVSNAMAAIGIGQTKIYELINNGTLKTVRVGRRRLIKTDSIRALVDQAA